MPQKHADRSNGKAPRAKSAPVTLDATDRRLLALLQEDSRISNADLAARIGLSPSPTLARVRKLERAGVVTRYTALLDARKVGYGALAFVRVAIALHRKNAIREFEQAVHRLPEVVECYHITGDADYLLKVVVRDIEAYKDFIINHVTALPGVRRVNTSFVLSAVASHKPLKIPEHAP